MHFASYALGLTILLTVTGLGSSNLVHRCKDLLMNPDDNERWVSPAVPSPEAGAWPPKVARGLVRLVVGLTWEPLAPNRMPVTQALESLEALVAAV